MLNIYEIYKFFYSIIPFEKQTNSTSLKDDLNLSINPAGEVWRKIT